jgi:hypothetical protein
MSELFKRVCKLLKIEKIHTTAYHPESNGAVERAHKSLIEYLRCFCNPKLNNWDEWLPFACFEYNTTPHSVTKFTPYEVLFGRIANIPGRLQKQPEPVYNIDDITLDIKHKMQSCHQVAKERLVKFKEKQRQKVKSNEESFKENNLVLLRVEGRQKLDPLWKGPFEIKEVQGSNAVIQELGKRKHHRAHTNKLKPNFSSVAGGKNAVKWTITLVLINLYNVLQAQEVNEIQSKTGIYFDEVGTLIFYPMKWKVVTYINLKPTRELWRQTKIQQKRVSEFCQKIKLLERIVAAPV